MSNPHELIVIFYRDNYHPCGSDSTYFSGLVSKTWLLKRVRKKGFVTLKNQYDECQILPRWFWEKATYEEMDNVKPRIPIEVFQPGR